MCHTYARPKEVTTCIALHPKSRASGQMRSHGTRDLTFHELARIPATQSGKYDAYAKNMGAHHTRQGVYTWTNWPDRSTGMSLATIRCQKCFAVLERACFAHPVRLTRR